MVKAFTTIASYLVSLWNNAQNSSLLAWLITCPKTAISGPRQNQLQPLTADCHIGPCARFLFCLIQHNDAVTDAGTILLYWFHAQSHACHLHTGRNSEHFCWNLCNLWFDPSQSFILRIMKLETFFDFLLVRRMKKSNKKQHVKTGIRILNDRCY